jgi:hypothetical protein
MPYIKKLDREDLDPLTEMMRQYCPTNAGELNYTITKLIHQYEIENGTSYQVYNDIIGALEGAKLELYRRRISVYEQKKIKQNGDV